MVLHSGITAVAALIGDPARTAILMALGDGGSLPAGELARLAHISPQTASSHLTKLVEGGLLVVVAQGRHRYYQFAGPEIAQVLETIGAVKSPPDKVHSLRESVQANALRFARTCYGHLAGKLGVNFTQAMVKKGFFEDLGQYYQLTDQGREWLEEFRLTLLPPNSFNVPIPHHIDWTERQHHISGPLALAITKRLRELEWITSGPVRRSLQVTEWGKEQFLQKLGCIYEPGV